MADGEDGAGVLELFLQGGIFAQQNEGQGGVGIGAVPAAGPPLPGGGAVGGVAGGAIGGGAVGGVGGAVGGVGGAVGGVAGGVVGGGAVGGVAGGAVGGGAVGGVGGGAVGGVGGAVGGAVGGGVRGVPFPQVGGLLGAMPAWNYRAGQPAAQQAVFANPEARRKQIEKTLAGIELHDRASDMEVAMFVATVKREAGTYNWRDDEITYMAIISRVGSSTRAQLPLGEPRTMTALLGGLRRMASLPETPTPQEEMDALEAVIADVKMDDVGTVGRYVGQLNLQINKYPELRVPEVKKVVWFKRGLSPWLARNLGVEYL